MNRFAKTISLTALVVATATAGTAGDPKLKLKHKNIQLQPQIGTRHTEHLQQALRSSCVDLAVFASKRRIGDRVRITYGVKNVSSASYVSGANQQAIDISVNGRSFAAGRFANLGPGQTRSWNVDVPLPFEFPNTYVVMFSHDPDLFIDGNEANDDCNRANNRRDLVVSHTG